MLTLQGALKRDTAAWVWWDGGGVGVQSVYYTMLKHGL
jgi:hypothetical protein